MGSHPINLALRFLLEISALAGIGYWGWKQHEGLWRLVCGIGIPVALMAIWVIFAVPNDPSRSGEAPIVTPGIIRLIYELLFFGFAVWALGQNGHSRLGLYFAIIIVLHYVISYDRIIWLLSQ